MIVQEQPSVSVIDSEALFAQAFQVTVWLYLATATALLLLFFLRHLNQKRLRERTEIQHYWQQQLFAACDATAPLPLDTIQQQHLKKRADLMLWFLQRWSQMHRYVRGDADDGLAILASQLELEYECLNLAERDDVRTLIAANIALGDLPELAPESVSYLVEQMSHRSSMVVLTALRALMRYHPRLALSLFLRRPQLVAPERLVAILKECPPNLLTAEVLQSILDKSPQHVAYLLRVLKGVKVALEPLALRKIIEKYSNDTDVLAASLGLIEHPKLLPLARRYLEHESIAVRVQATAALGRFAQPGDEPLLWRQLSDSAWWVRYRAAEALYHLPNVDPNDLMRRAHKLKDPFARDMMEQMYAEVTYGH